MNRMVKAGWTALVALSTGLVLGDGAAVAQKPNGKRTERKRYQQFEKKIIDRENKEPLQDVEGSNHKIHYFAAKKKG